ncbi:MAG: ADP-ribose diphosphatase, partial [Deltaproteobacteria bacterium]|nr:ADP-ribose diphosphatase [Deltaproteobacteria bacterium]
SGEEISVELRPVKELPALISQGLIDHALILNALFWYLMPRLRPQTKT